MKRNRKVRKSKARPARWEIPDELKAGIANAGARLGLSTQSALRIALEVGLKTFENCGFDLVGAMVLSLERPMPKDPKIIPFPGVS